MSTSRLLSVLVTVGLVVVMVVAVGAAATANVSNSAPDQFDRHPSGIARDHAQGALDQFDRHAVAVNSAEVARIEFRRGEWSVSHAAEAALDQFDRHPSSMTATYTQGALDQLDRHVTTANSVEKARIDFRRGKWNARNSVGIAELDMEQTRIQWYAGK